MTMISGDTVNGMQRVYGKTANNIKYGTALAGTGAALLAIHKDSYISKKAGQVAGYVGGKLGNVLAKTKTGAFVKDVAAKTGKYANPVVKGVKNVFGKIAGTSFVQNTVKKVAPYLAKIPFKPVATVAALLTAAVLIHNHGRNSGKIDQRYQDKQLLAKGFELCS